jgi:hypothetical protein
MCVSWEGSTLDASIIINSLARPISICNVVYKSIAKCLSNRLKPHLSDYIHPSQVDFIEGRRISTNIIIAQEMAHTFVLSTWKSKSFMLKIDLVKVLIDLSGISSLRLSLVKSCMVILLT